jgi:predicted phosphate transport protein (TIGR00153 family)
MLDEHVKACAKCVAKLPDYFDAAQAGKWAKAAKVQAEIVDLEGIADDLKRNVRRNMPRGIWMSVSRSDLLELVRMQDTMANHTKDVVGLSLGRELAFPAPLEKSLAKYIKTIVDCVGLGVEVGHRYARVVANCVWRPSSEGNYDEVAGCREARA